MLHLIWKCFGRLDRIRQIRLPASYLVPFFQRRPRWYSTKPAWIWSGLPSQVLAKFIWSGSKPVRARIIRSVSGRTQPTHYRFPTFSLRCILPQTAWIILCKTSPDPIWFWLRQVLGKWICVEASQCARILGPTLLSRSGSDANQIWHDFWQGSSRKKTFKIHKLFTNPCNMAWKSNMKVCNSSAHLVKGSYPYYSWWLTHYQSKLTASAFFVILHSRLKQFLTTVRSWEMQFLTDKPQNSQTFTDSTQFSHPFKVLKSLSRFSPNF